MRSVQVAALCAMALATAKQITKYGVFCGWIFYQVEPVFIGWK